jgi:hypothetical protein
MGLSISVGQLAWSLAEGYEEETEYARRDVQEINRVLVANGLPAHVEPETLPPFRNRCKGVGLPYSMIHYLRRACAFARQAPDEFTPAPAGSNPARDPRVDRELSVMFDSHLICHSDCDGFYVPLDFPEPLYDSTDDLAGGILGSSYGAMEELVLVAPVLGIRLVKGILPDAVADEINNERDGPLNTERYVWLKLFEKFRQSIEQKAVVTFG